MAERKKDTRQRNWATIVYPESAPDNWLNILGDLVVPCCVSPLHDLDLNPTGEIKKPHYHVIFMFEGKKSFEQIESIVSLICGVGCEPIASIRGYARYLCHLDNPDKAQYSQDDVKSFGGADFAYLIGLVTDKYKAISEMISFCIEYNIVSYSELLEYSMEQRSDWFRVLCDNGTVVVKEYLKSKVWTNSYNRR